MHKPDHGRDGQALFQKGKVQTHIRLKPRRRANKSESAELSIIEAQASWIAVGVETHSSILGMWLGQVLLYPAGVGVPHDA